MPRTPTHSSPSSLMVLLVGSSVPILYQNMAYPPRYPLIKGKCCRSRVEPEALPTQMAAKKQAPKKATTTGDSIFFVPSCSTCTYTPRGGFGGGHVDGEPCHARGIIQTEAVQHPLCIRCNSPAYTRIEQCIASVAAWDGKAREVLRK